MRFALSGSAISNELALPEELWPCEIDAGQIGQVIDNLVIAAVQAMPSGIVKRHGGTIEVESEPGRGTVFSLALPAVAGASPPRAAEAPSAEPLDTGRLLLMDDEPVIQRTVARMCAALGYFGWVPR